MAPSILIVEDEATIADAVAYALEKEGFATRRASLGSAALESIRAEPPALVVLDVGLPDLSGFEVCRRLRTFSDVPVVFLTARSEEVDRIVGLEIGGDDYVLKPFSPRELVARVRVILRRLEPRRLPPGPVPVFQVDEARRSVAFQGQALELTRYEYLLLKTLLGSPGRVFTRTQLMESVWSAAEESTERTVDAHVKTLRAKLRAVDPEADPILTHRGVGYSLETRP
jgi:two-component system catabolic regulation response regulator CreB